jgi:hypothetical protein
MLACEISNSANWFRISNRLFLFEHRFVNDTAIS